MSNRTKAAALFCCLALVSGACSSARVDDNPTQATSPGQAGEPAADKKKRKGKGKGGRNAAEKILPEDAVPEDPGASASGRTAGTTAPLQPLGPGGPEFARRSAHVEEPQPDAEKDGPLVADYAEAMAVDVQGLGRDLRITFTMNGEVPQRMPTSQTVMVIAFGLSGPNKKHGGFAFGAQARDNGWTAYAGAKNKSTRFPGKLIIRGDQIEMTVPWDFVDGPRPFEWYASSSWFRSTGERNTTSYSFDVIPNGKGRYPN